MFSLIITIIAIALVAALALATIYYGGSAFNKSAASANAAKLMNQSQQILGADRLYRVDHEGAMPPSMQALIDGGYLKTIPVAQAEGQFNANAAGTAWTMIASPTGRAYSFSSGVVDSDSCKALNQMSLGKDGILNKVFTGFKTQCYGADSTHLAIVVVADPDALGTNGSTNTELPYTPVINTGSEPGSSDWSSAPSDSGSSGSGSSGGSGGGSSPAPTYPSYSLTTGATITGVTVPEEGLYGWATISRVNCTGTAQNHDWFTYGASGVPGGTSIVVDTTSQDWALGTECPVGSLIQIGIPNAYGNDIYSATFVVTP